MRFIRTQSKVLLVRGCLMLDYLLWAVNSDLAIGHDLVDPIIQWNLVKMYDVLEVPTEYGPAPGHRGQGDVQGIEPRKSRIRCADGVPLRGRQHRARRQRETCLDSVRS